MSHFKICPRYVYQERSGSSRYSLHQFYLDPDSTARLIAIIARRRDQRGHGGGARVRPIGEIAERSDGVFIRAVAGSRPGGIAPALFKFSDLSNPARSQSQRA